MLFAPRPLPATFLSRPNRFLGIAELDGQRVECFIPNPGRLRELLQPGARVYLQKRRGVGRKTGYDLILAEKNVSWCQSIRWLPTGSSGRRSAPA
jgi:sugar fermentation stimulation protein A